MKKALIALIALLAVGTCIEASPWHQFVQNVARPLGPRKFGSFTHAASIGGGAIGTVLGLGSGTSYGLKDVRSRIQAGEAMTASKAAGIILKNTGFSGLVCAAAGSGFGGMLGTSAYALTRAAQGSWALLAKGTKPILQATKNVLQNLKKQV